MAARNVQAAPISAGARLRITGFVYSATTLLSAGLLFCVEPMFSKMALPVLGGTAAVWSVAMAVFQALLLAGYLYAHLLTRQLEIRRAALVHVGVLVIAAVSLPIALPAGYDMPPTGGVSLWLVALFLMAVGLPFFALSANAPLLQAWLARSDCGKVSNVYLLYRASNFGSFAVLLAYPFLIEPSFGLVLQSRLWTAAYGVLVFAIAGCAVLAIRKQAGPSSQVPVAAARSDSSWKDRLMWAALGFIPSGLLVAVTAHIATDVASGPFLWIMPLALYLLTFVFAFSDTPALPPKLMFAVQPFTTALLVVVLLWTGKVNWGISLAGNLLAFFVAAMVCQTQLYRRRPAASELTQFYLWMSLGGVFGGGFAALLAPQIFPTVLEYPLLVFGALLVRPDVWRTPRTAWLKDGIFVLFLAAAFGVPLLVLSYPAAYFGTAVMVLAALMAFQGGNPARLVGIAAMLLLATNLYDPSQHIVYRARSFYGVYTAVELQHGKFRVLYQGTTAHGAEQIRDDNGALLTSRPEPLTYYYRGGPYSEAIEAARARAGGRLNRVALVGLGMGTQSCAGAAGETWTFYELDPLSVEIAHDKKLFRSVSLCAPQAATVIGDGRLTLQRAAPGFDLLILDVFSSDSVPLHMLTREAFALYKSRLAPHGAIAFNISNKHLELAKVVASSAWANGMVTSVKRGAFLPDSDKTLHLRAQVAVVTRSAADMKALRLGPGWRIVTPVLRAWSDDYSDILGAILRKMKE
jgi:spermidine synthase